MNSPALLAPLANIQTPDGAVLNAGARQMLAFIESFEVDSNESFDLAADELRAIKSKQKTLEEQRTSITKPLNDVTKAVNALFKAPTELLESAEAKLKQKMLGWQRVVEARAAEERRIAEEAARIEREKAAAEAAERERQAKEAQARADAEAAAGNVQAAAVAEAAAQQARDEAAQAAATAQMVIAAPSVAATAAPKAKGISTSTRIDYEVTNLLALVQHVAANPELIGLLMVDTVKLRNYVKGLGTACRLPGVRVIEQTSMSARAA